MADALSRKVELRHVMAISSLKPEWINIRQENRADVDTPKVAEVVSRNKNIRSMDLVRRGTSFQSLNSTLVVPIDGRNNMGIPFLPPIRGFIKSFSTLGHNSIGKG